MKMIMIIVALLDATSQLTCIIYEVVNIICIDNQVC